MVPGNILKVKGGNALNIFKMVLTYNHKRRGGRLFNDQEQKKVEFQRLILSYKFFIAEV